MTKRAILYGRVSTDDRDKDSRNLRGQLDMARDYATERGYRVIGELAEDDRGASGADIDLPQLQKILTLAEEGAIDVVIAREIDRLSRTLVKQLVVESRLRELGVTVEYVLADYEETPEGQLAKMVRAVIAEYERVKIQERMTRGKVLAVRQGRTMTHSRPPYGYRLDDAGQFVVHDEEARIVRQIFDWYIDEGLGYNKVAERLTEMGIPTWGDKRPDKVNKDSDWGVWNPSTIRVIIRNRAYTGEWRYYTGDTVDVPPIIDKDRWLAAQRVRRESYHPARYNAEHDYLLQRRAKCGECGGLMYCRPHVSSTSGRTKLYYECQRHRPCWYVPVARADSAVWAFIDSLMTPDVLSDVMDVLRNDAPDTAGLEAERDTIAVRIGAAETRHDRLMDLYLHGEFELEELERRRNSIELELVDLRDDWHELTERIQAAEAANPEYMAELFAILHDDIKGAGDFETRRAVVDEVDIWVVFERLPPPPGRKRHRWGARVHFGDLGEVGRVEL